MNTLVLIMTVFFLCVRITSADTGCKSDPNDVGVKSQQDRVSPVQVQLQVDRTLPVEVSMENGKGLPVRLQGEWSKKKPLPVAIQSEKALVVDVKNKSVPADDCMMPQISTWIAIAIAAIAAFAAWKAVHYTKLVAEGTLFFKLIREYSDKRMCDDLRIIFNWGRKHKYSDKLFNKNENNTAMEDAAREYANAVHPDVEKILDSDVDLLDKARRHITHYFLSILDLQEGRYVKKSFAERVCKATDTSVLKRALYLEKALIDRLGELDNKKEGIEQSKKDLKEKIDKLIALSKGS